jgi:hypothetical protein
MLEDQVTYINLINMNKNHCLIYVKLIDEGVDVWRPVLASMTARNGHYKIIDVSCNENYAEEKWEFAVGQIVRGEMKSLNGQQVVVAVASVADD